MTPLSPLDRFFLSVAIGGMFASLAFFAAQRTARFWKAPFVRLARASRHVQAFVLSVFFATTVHADQPMVSVGESEIPLVVVSQATAPVDTNSLAREFTAYFGASSDIGRFFRTNGLQTGNSARMIPSGREEGPPPEIASDIRYFGAPGERIVVGDLALAWILGKIEAAAPFMNSWTQAEALISGLRSGSITNCMQTCRESFLIDGAVHTNETEDAQMVAGIASYWSRLSYPSPSAIGFRTGQLVEGGPEVPALFCQCLNPESKSPRLFPVVLVFVDGRWRVVLQ